MAPKKKATTKTAAKSPETAVAPEGQPVNLKDLIVKLRAAVEARQWFDAARLVADLIRSAADLGELVVGGSATVQTDVTAEIAGLEQAVADAKAAPAAAGVDPGTVLQLVMLAIELWKQWKQKQ